MALWVGLKMQVYISSKSTEAGETQMHLSDGASNSEVSVKSGILPQKLMRKAG